MKGLILAAGRGNRLIPLTWNKPKAMIPLLGKPLIEYNLENLKKAGIREVIIVVSPNSDLIQKTYGDGHHIDLDIKYAIQEKPLGTAHAIYTAKEYLGDDSFLVCWCDNLTKFDLANLIQKHREMRHTATLALNRLKSPRKGGIAEIKYGRIIRVIENPLYPPSNLNLAGMYIFESDIFSAIEKTKPSQYGEYYLPDSIQILIDEGAQIDYVIVDRWRLNINSCEDLLLAQRKLLEGFCLKSSIKPDFLFIPPVHISNGISVCKTSLIGPFVSLGKNVEIEENVEIENSILMDEVKITHNCHITNAILGCFSTVKESIKSYSGLYLGDYQSA